MIFEAMSHTVLAGRNAVLLADRLACSVFVYRVPRDRILDRVLGPVEVFEYARTTTPK